jgi:copper homeostasis protein
MKKTIDFCKKNNISGVVFGCLNEKLELDLEKIKYLSKIANPMKVIIHKAIDLTNSPIKSLKKLLEINLVDGVLSSGGADTAYQGINVLRKMIDMIPENFELISAGKITADNLDFIHEKINGKFYHGRKIVGEL